MFLFGTRHWANFFNRYRRHIRCFDKFNLYSILCQLEQIVFGLVRLRVCCCCCCYGAFLLHTAVCVFSLGKLDINNVQIKSSSHCGRQNLWRVLVSICCASLYAQFSFSSSSIYVFTRWPYRQWWGPLRGAWAVRCHATGEITCWTLGHASPSDKVCCY